MINLVIAGSMINMVSALNGAESIDWSIFMMLFYHIMYFALRKIFKNFLLAVFFFPKG